MCLMAQCGQINMAEVSKTINAMQDVCKQLASSNVAAALTFADSLSADSIACWHASTCLRLLTHSLSLCASVERLFVCLGIQ